jgi:hypothetical protein
LPSDRTRNRARNSANIVISTTVEVMRGLSNHEHPAGLLSRAESATTGIAGRRRLRGREPISGSPVSELCRGAPRRDRDARFRRRPPRERDGSARTTAPSTSSPSPTVPPASTTDAHPDTTTRWGQIRRALPLEVG